MKKNIVITLLVAATLSSCGEYNKLLKSTDYEYKYEAAKNYFAKGQYGRSATLLNELITILKGTDKAEESLYMLGMSYYNQKDYSTAAQTFITYIRRKHGWISRVLIRLFSNYRHSLNIIRQVLKSRKHKTWFLLFRINLC